MPQEPKVLLEPQAAREPQVLMVLADTAVVVQVILIQAATAAVVARAEPVVQVLQVVQAALVPKVAPVEQAVLVVHHS